MNPYQAKLESIQAKRLNMQQRINAGIKSALWLLSAIYFTPFALATIWQYADMGYGIDMQQQGWSRSFLYLSTTLISLALVLLFFYALIQSKTVYPITEWHHGTLNKAY